MANARHQVRRLAQLFQPFQAHGDLCGCVGRALAGTHQGLPQSLQLIGQLRRQLRAAAMGQQSVIPQQGFAHLDERRQFQAWLAAVVTTRHVAHLLGIRVGGVRQLLLQFAPAQVVLPGLGVPRRPARRNRSN